MCKSQADFEKRVDKNDKGQMSLLEEMRAHVKKVNATPFAHHDGCSSELPCMNYLFVVQLEDLRKNEDPRLSFATPEFKEAQRTFTEHFKVVC